MLSEYQAAQHLALEEHKDRLQPWKDTRIFDWPGMLGESEAWPACQGVR